MALSDIVDDLDVAVNRGSIFSYAQLKDVIWRAIQYYERKYDLEYTFSRANTVAITSGTKAYSWGFSQEIKRLIRSWREDDDGLIYEIPQAQEFRIIDTQADEDGTLYPAAWVSNGRTGFEFDCTPSEAFTFKVAGFFYTTKDADDAATNWLIENAGDLLLHRAAMEIGVIDQDPELVQMHQGMEKEKLDVLLDAEEQFRWGASQLEMIYEG